MAQNYSSHKFTTELKETRHFSEHVIVVEGVHLDSSSDILWDGTIIENVIFEKGLHFENINIKSGILFHNCEFKDGVFFKDIKSYNFNRDRNPSDCSLLFNNCKSSSLIIINSILEKGLRVHESNFGTIKIYDTHIIDVGAGFSESKVSESFDINNLISSLVVKKSVLKKNFRISTIKGDVSLLQSTFEGWFKLWNIESSFSITFNKNTFNEDVLIECVRLDKGLFIHEDVFEKKFEFLNYDRSQPPNESRINEIYVTDAKFIQGALFEGRNQKLDDLKLDITPKLEGVITFEGWEINGVHIFGLNQNLKILFKNIFF